MSNIRQVQWNEGAPVMVQPGMLIDEDLYGVLLIGDTPPEGPLFDSMPAPMVIKRWAWLIQPHELNWLEDMAFRKTRTQE
ncbi:hypothetical protein I5I61_18785 [Pseudomonas nitroreducens]|uniref:Uncharacterized protein n=1 Tax=Pseudomonas nitroreducens TaxID=46680 RepID=A0ABS0KQ76_PSENT|nr:hypothetical protein [Pseudomonas nitroreducens]MBG6289505.1 hypothetical protein [Pseudomonas nitroreducens]